jgi:hypothetical protein
LTGLFGDHNARVQEGARNATLVDQNGAWHLRIKYDPPIIAEEHWDVLIAWKRQYTPSFTEAILKSSDILKQEWEITVCRVFSLSATTVPFKKNKGPLPIL